MVKLSPAFSWCENYVRYVSGAFGGELQGLGGGSTHARLTGGGTWTPTSLVQYCTIIKCSESASLPEILDSPPSCYLPHILNGDLCSSFASSASVVEHTTKVTLFYGCAYMLGFGDSCTECF